MAMQREALGTKEYKEDRKSETSERGKDQVKGEPKLSMKMPKKNCYFVF